ncbi:hypothetical protein SUGI_0727940 [Cryptomeria japonica]|nr:hypothetical protein SUGI_0727940 [Cryptomeria japonica]
MNRLEVVELVQAIKQDRLTKRKRRHRAAADVATTPTRAANAARSARPPALRPPPALRRHHRCSAATRLRRRHQCRRRLHSATTPPPVPMPPALRDAACTAAHVRRTDFHLMAPPKSTSEAWKHVTRNGTHIKCNMCQANIIGTLTRLRDHFLANKGGLGGGVQACTGATPELKAILEKELAASTVGKMKKAQKKQRIEGDISRFTSAMSSSFVQSEAASVPKQSGTLNNFWKPVEKQQVDDAVADLFYTSAIPFNVARNPHFRNAVQKIVEFGKGYTPPGSEAIRTTLLQRSKDRVTEKLADHASKELLRPCETRFASYYITLKRVVEEKAALRSIICSNQWESSVLSKGPKGKNIEQIILNSNFWESAAKVLLVCEPIVDVLRMVDGLYQAISRYVPNPEIAALIRDQSWQYKRGEGMFGGAEAKYDSPRINLKLLMNKSVKNTSLQQTLEGMAMPDADEPDFVDDELSSDTDDDDLASQPSALDDLELF